MESQRWTIHIQKRLSGKISRTSLPIWQRPMEERKAAYWCSLTKRSRRRRIQWEVSWRDTVYRCSTLPPSIIYASYSLMRSSSLANNQLSSRSLPAGVILITLADLTQGRRTFLTSLRDGYLSEDLKEISRRLP